MAYTFDTSTSHGRMRSYCVQVEAGLEAMTPLAAKASDWQAMKQAVVEHRSLWEGGADAVTKAQTRNRVSDANWDASYTEGSGIAFLLSGKKSKSDPYATIMRVPASRATSLGYVKATEIGDRVLAAVERFALPPLSEWASGFASANDALKASGQGMDAAEDALDDPRFGKRALVRRLNDLIAVTEAFILTQFPGRSALADAILVPPWASKRGKRKDAPDADAPEDDEPSES